METIVLDDLSDGHPEAVIVGNFIQGDFGDKDFIQAFLVAEKFDAIVHFAAFASVPDSVTRPQRYYDNNVTKMLTLLDAAVAAGIKYFVFLLQQQPSGNLNIYLLMKSILKSQLIPMA